MRKKVYTILVSVGDAFIKEYTDYWKNLFVYFYQYGIMILQRRLFM